MVLRLFTEHHMLLRGGLTQLQYVSRSPSELMQFKFGMQN